VAAWFIKDFLFGLYQKRVALERHEWEYRLKEVYCPLYYWSGLLMFDTNDEERIAILEAINAIMARGAYTIAQRHYYTFVRLVEHGYLQKTSGAAEEEIAAARQYLYNHIEALTALLYRMEATAGVGDPSAVLNPYRRMVRFALIAVSQVLVWAVVAGAIGGVLWLWQQQQVAWVGALVVVLLAGLWVDVRQRNLQRRGVRDRLAPNGHE
jgi:hypothetical protein